MAPRAHARGAHFRSAANPVLRDLTERVVIASKGRFDRALSRADRAARDRPSEGSIFKDEFMEATTDLWDIPAESATRVGHPAPFPVELPQRLIELYTYVGDLVLDPFMGSGTTAVAAIRTHRHFVGYDTDPTYVALANERIELERERLRRSPTARPVLLAVPSAEAADDEGFQARAVRQGQKAEAVARAILLQCGFSDVKENVRMGSGVEVNFTARDQGGRLWCFDVSGAFTSPRPGLRRTDTVWKALGRAAILRLEFPKEPQPLILLSTNLPARGSAGFLALKRVAVKCSGMRWRCSTARASSGCVTTPRVMPAARSATSSARPTMNWRSERS